MTYSDTSVIIHLISNDNSSKGDDVITIRKNLETGEFKLNYRDQNNGSPVVHNVDGLYRARVLEYIYTLFKNQSLDEEGYQSVQLTLPALPRVIVSGDKFKELYYRDHFLEAVGTGLDLLENTEAVKAPKARRFTSVGDEPGYYGFNTPVSRRSTAPGVRPQHLYFDEDI